MTVKQFRRQEDALDFPLIGDKISRRRSIKMTRVMTTRKTLDLPPFLQHRGVLITNYEQSLGDVFFSRRAASEPKRAEPSGVESF